MGLDQFLAEISGVWCHYRGGELCLGSHNSWRSQGGRRVHNFSSGRVFGWDLRCRLCSLVPVLPGCW
uniref:Uncharacterized protein n=1 Tax=Arundo donax TaxID=35708 RepID=A0A0A9D6B8_ARUDO